MNNYYICVRRFVASDPDLPHSLYITFNYMPCNIPPALVNNRLVILISGPISNITVGPGPISVIGPAFLQLD